MQRALHADDLVRPVLAIDHRNRPKETVAADVLFAEIAKTDPRLTDVAALGVVDPGTHCLGSSLEMARAVRNPKATLVRAADCGQPTPASDRARKAAAALTSRQRFSG
jgi:hypothetical protein